MWLAIALTVMVTGAAGFCLLTLMVLWRIEDALNDVVARMPETPFLGGGNDAPGN